MRTEASIPPTAGRTEHDVAVTRVTREGRSTHTEAVTLEEPLEIQLEHGPAGDRRHRSISVTMRTPGHDRELALGFLHTEGVLGEEVDLDDLHIAQPETVETVCGPDVEAIFASDDDEIGKIPTDDVPTNGVSSGDASLGSGSRTTRTAAGIVRVAVAPGVPVRTASLERNFYATSSCGICGKASLAALRSVAPPRRSNDFIFDPALLFQLPERMYAGQNTFHHTGGLHAAALFNVAGELELLREDIGRHNAVDKLIGASFLADRLPLRHSLLLLSGRASFELLQKAVMAGIPAVAAIGAPSSLAIQVAKDFNLTLAGFLRADHFNIYNGEERLC